MSIQGALSPLKNPNEGSTKGHQGVGVQEMIFCSEGRCKKNFITFFFVQMSVLRLDAIFVLLFFADAILD